MPQSTSPALQGFVCLDLYATSRAVIKAYGNLLADMHLTYPQFLVMTSLWQEQPLTVSKLAEYLSLDSGTLSPLLKRLEAAGYVERRRNIADERSVDIHLTEKGKELKPKAEGVCVSMGDLFGLEPEELAALQTLLRKIEKRMAKMDS